MKGFIQQILRYKIIHVIYWLWHAVLVFHEKEQNHPDPAGHLRHVLDTASQILMQMAAVYFIIYYLLPRLVHKEKYIRFFISMVVTILSAALLLTAIQLAYLTTVFHFNHPTGVLVTGICAIIDLAPIVIMFVVIVLIHYFYTKDKTNKLIEKERLESELNFLKAQINPHFLFNALNSIYVLMKEDVKLAETTLLRFSSLLRYQLYECNLNTTSLESEVEFLKNFIALEKVRTGENLDIRFHVPEHIPYLQMTPFILIPFVENAFKHVSHFKSEPNSILILIEINGQQLTLNVQNTFDHQLNQNGNGIGLQNVKRRLELLYPNAHTLNISQDEKFYIVDLTLEIHEN